MLIVACVACVAAWHRLSVLGAEAVPWAEAYPGLRTGDLVLFRSRAADPLRSVVSAFSHVGMVVDPGKGSGRPKLVLETHHEGDTDHMGFKRRGGVNLYDLDHRVATYDGNVYVLSLDPGFTLDGAAVLDRVGAYAKMPFADGYRSWYIQQCMLRRGPRQPPTAVFCSQFVGLVLRDFGVLPPDANVWCLNPQSFVAMEGVYASLKKIQRRTA